MEPRPRLDRYQFLRTWIILNNFHRFQNFRQFSNLFSQNWLESDTRHSFLECGAKSGNKFIKNSQKNAKFDEENEKKSEIHYSIAKKCWRLLAEILRLKNGAKKEGFEERCKGVHCVDLGESFPTFTCKNRRRYSREWAPRSLGKIQFNIHSPP